MTVAQRVTEIRERIAAAAARAGRDPADVRLVAVTKTHPAGVVQESAQAGVLDVGENKVQEALAKLEELAGSGMIGPGHGREPGDACEGQVRWHLIGHLQSNKARQAVRYFDLIHSVDSERLARELEAQCAKTGRPWCNVLLQVNVSGEETKGGVEPEELQEVIQRILENCPHLHIEGFMTMAPFELEPEQTRPHFRRLRELRDRMRERFAGHERFHGAELSMGMTNDFEVAIEEGATIVRIGSAIFGARGGGM